MCVEGGGLLGMWVEEHVCIESGEFNGWRRGMYEGGSSLTGWGGVCVCRVGGGSFSGWGGVCMRVDAH